MKKFYSFPHQVLNVKDESIRTPLVVAELALHRPLYLGYAERGIPGVPVYGSYEDHAEVLGKGTFDMFSNYYKHPSLFFERMLQKNKAFFVRLVADDAEVSSIVIECTAMPVGIIQYQKDVDGFFLTDTNGDYIPIDDGGTPLVEDGIVLKWTARAMTPAEKINNIEPSTQSVADPFGGANIEVTTYPIVAFQATSPGGWGNVTGIKLSWNSDSDESVAVSMDAMIFTAELVTIPYGADTPETVRTKYLDPTTEFTFRPDTTDKATMRRYALDEVIQTDYDSLNIPFTFHNYSDNVKAIGDLCMAVENLLEYPEITSEFMINIFDGKAMDGRPYSHIQVDTDTVGSIFMDADVITYMVGGLDGTTDDETLEELTRIWLSGSVFPEVEDSARYPITHLYDSGYEMATKEALIDFLSIKDDVKVVLSTQSVYEEPNIKSEDQAAGSYLRAKALLHSESYIYGTQACRVTILQQCGYLNETTPYTRLVPATIDCMMKKGTWQGATYIKGKPKGLPHSDVSIIKDINWFPVTNDFKQLSWDAALNYMQYYDMNRVHYPDVISVYPYKTSLLSDDVFNDFLIYIKHITRFQWAKFAGVDWPVNDLITKVNESVSKAIYKALGNHIRIEVNAYQTELDAELGYALTVEIAVYGTVSNRVWNVIVPVRREIANV